MNNNNNNSNNNNNNNNPHNHDGVKNRMFRDQERTEDESMDGRQDEDQKEVEISMLLLRENTPPNHAFAAANGNDHNDDNENSTTAKVKKQNFNPKMQQQKDHDKSMLEVILLMTLFVSQNTISALLGRYNRTRKDVPQYNVANMLMVAEILKLFLSCLLESRQKVSSSLLFFSFSFSLQLLYNSLKLHLYDHFYDDALPLAIPALLYFLQNSLYMQSFGLLPVTLFQVTTHSKVIVLAILSTLFLKRQYSALQWLSVFWLTAGISMVSIFGTTTNTSSSSKNINSSNNNTVQQQDNNEDRQNHPTAKKLQQNHISTITSGLILLWMANFSSSIAAIYFERVIKATRTAAETTMANETTRARKQPPAPSLWMRNIQLSLFTLPFALWSQQMTTRTTAETIGKGGGGFFAGFTPLVFLQVLLFGVGGLLVAALIRSTSNVHKSFAMGLSVVASSALSLVLFEDGDSVHLTGSFYFGTAVILLSAYGFAQGGNGNSTSKIRRHGTRSHWKMPVFFATGRTTQ